MRELETLRANIGGGCGNPWEKATEALLALGPAAVPYLRAAVDDRDEKVGALARRVLVHLGRRKEVDDWCRQYPEREPCPNLDRIAAMAQVAASQVAAGGSWTGGSIALVLSPGGTGSFTVKSKTRGVRKSELDGERLALALADGSAVVLLWLDDTTLKILAGAHSSVLRLKR